jgi:hypothetical protein
LAGGRAAKAEKELAKERVARGKDQARVVDVKDTLKGVYLERGAFREKEKNATAELKNLSLAYAEVQTKARADREVLQQVKQIAAGKPFILLQRVFGRKGFIELTQVW